MNHVFDKIMEMKTDRAIVAFLAICVIVGGLFSSAICFVIMWLTRWFNIC